MSEAIVPPCLEILSPGAYSSLQDLGRRGLRRVGVPWSGVLDAGLMRIANTLAGNAADHPVIECFDGGLRVAARGGPLRLAVAGNAMLEIESAGARRALAAWRSVSLADGEVLNVRGLRQGRLAMVALAGLAAKGVLGSASTYPRAELGGVDGRALAAGMRLAACVATGPERALATPPRPDDNPIRVVAGPQADRFTALALDRLAAAEYRVTPDADRMGMRLVGPVLEHRGAPEIVSDATVPGAIQVPGNGQPIVLLADSQTVGGYPKIATVISTDLPRLAARRPGETVRFTVVDVALAQALARTRAAELADLLGTVRPLAAEGADTTVLYSVNLVGGVVDALDPR